MYSFGLHNNKGGVGKSTHASILASILSYFGKTCLIDGDSQGSVTSGLLQDVSSIKYELADLLSNGDLSCEDVLVNVSELKELANRQLFLLPTLGRTEATNRLNALAKSGFFHENIGIFTELLRLLKEDEGFDFVVFDMHPALTDLERTMIFAVDEMLLPLSPEYFDIMGVEGLQGLVKQVNKTINQMNINRAPIKFDKLLINKVNLSFSRHVHQCHNLAKSGYRFVFIPQDSAIPNSQFVQMILDEYDPDSKALHSIYTLVDMLFKDYNLTISPELRAFLDERIAIYNEYERSVLK